MPKMRKLGNVLLDMEPLLNELADQHCLQRGDIIALIFQQITMHNPQCIEEFDDNTRPVYFYGHESLQPKKATKYPL